MNTGAKTRDERMLNGVTCPPQICHFLPSNSSVGLRPLVGVGALEYYQMHLSACCIRRLTNISWNQTAITIRP